MSKANQDKYDPKILDIYSYKEKFPWVQQKLWFCAGADIELLKQCPRSEQIKEEGIGGIVLATALLAFLSGSYAMYVVFGPKVGLALSEQQQALDIWAAIKALIFGIAWSAIIFNLDRFVVSSTGHGDGTEKISWSELGRALPRIAMAILIGLCLSAPLEIRVMQSEIAAELNQRQTDEVNKLDAKNAPELNTRETYLQRKKAEAELAVKKLDEQLDHARVVIEQQRQKLDLEAEGKAGNRVAGMGPGYRSKKENLDKQEAERAEFAKNSAPEKERLQAELKQTVAAIEALIVERKAQHDKNQTVATNLDGLVTRIHIAHDIGGWTYLIITMLLMIIEIGPIFFKMMMIRGPYSYLVDNQNAIVLAKFGITIESKMEAGSNSKQVVEENFHQASTIREYELGQLRAEQRLADIAREKFVERVGQDIEANPDKYIVPGTQT